MLLLKHIFKWAKRLVIWFFAFILIYLLIAYVCSNITTSPQPQNNQNLTIYVASSGVHTDIFIPIEKLNIADKLDLKPSTKYVAFGWGDKGFFINTPTWGDLTASVAIKAMFLKSETAMHVTEYQYTESHWKPVRINSKQLNLIQENINHSFKRNTNNKFIKIEGYTYGNNDTFYEGKGSYSCLKTCNTWTNSILKNAHIKTAIWTPFDFGILKHL